MVREHSSCLEASRATALAAHSAASLAAAAGLREAARLLRSSEALARAATAALLSSTPCASGAKEKTPVQAAAAPAARQHKKKSKKKRGADSLHVATDGSLAVDVLAAVLPPAVAFQLSPNAPAFALRTAAASGRVLEKKPSRERSPRRDASPVPHSFSPTSASSTTTLAALVPAGAGSEGGFSVGQAALLVGLVTRPELAGSSVTLRSFDVASSRWAVALGSTGESIRVKAHNLKSSLFKPGAFAAGAT